MAARKTGKNYEVDQRFQISLFNEAFYLAILSLLGKNDRKITMGSV